MGSPEDNNEQVSTHLKKAAFKLVKEVMLIASGQTVIMTVDNRTDSGMVGAIAEAVEEQGAMPVVITYPSRINEGIDLPLAVGAAICSSDVWLEFAEGYALYTPTRLKAREKGVRYSTLTGMDTDLLIRAIGEVDYRSLLKLGEILKTIIHHAHKFTITSKAGTKFSGKGRATYVALSGTPNPAKGSTTMLIGTVGWICDENQLNGKLVVDGALWPPKEIGAVHDSIYLTVKNGRVIEIEGGKEALLFKEWLKDLNDENMYRLAHLTIGYHPNVKKPSQKILENERLYGCFEFGLGSQGRAFGAKWTAKSHADAVITRPTIIFDEHMIIDDGSFVHTNLNDNDFRKIVL